MKFFSKVHGTLTYEEKEVIDFKKGIPGFEGKCRYILKDLVDCEPFKILHSLDDNNLAFIVVSPFEVEEKYEIKLTEVLINDIKINSPEDVLLLSTVTLNSDKRKITVNLKAPLVININEGLGEQLIVDNDKYLIKHPLIKE